MKKFTSIAFLGLISAANATFAQDKTPAPMDHSKMQGMDHSAMTKPAQLKIAPEEKDAVATIERFNLALSAGQLSKAGAELDANVLILESGGAEHTAAEYLGGHAKGDAAFLKTAHVQLIRRTIQVSGIWPGCAAKAKYTPQRTARWSRCSVMKPWC